MYTYSLYGPIRVAVNRQVFPYLESHLPAILARVLPGGGRILSDNYYAHAALQRSPYELVPTWSRARRSTTSSSTAPMPCAMAMTLR